MKALKQIVSYINWQQFAMSDSHYKLPKTLCSTFWLTLIGVITIPLTWIGNFWNLIRCRFRIGYQDNDKINFVAGAGINLVLVAFGKLLDILAYPAYNIITEVEFLASPLLGYFKLIGSGLLFCIPFGITILLLYLFIAGIISIASWISNFFEDKNIGSKSDKDSNLIASTLKGMHSIKNKYCPIIEWDDVIKSDKYK